MQTQVNGGMLNIGHTSSHLREAVQKVLLALQRVLELYLVSRRWIWFVADVNILFYVIALHRVFQ